MRARLTRTVLALCLLPLAGCGNGNSPTPTDTKIPVVSDPPTNNQIFAVLD